MPFELGNKHSKGRPAGSYNKRTTLFLQVLEDAGFCPATALMDVYKTAMAKFVEEEERVQSGKLSPMESKASHYLRIAGEKASDLAGYAYPKLKAVEQQKVSATADMTKEEKLQAAKMMVQLLEAEIKTDGSGDP